MNAHSQGMRHSPSSCEGEEQLISDPHGRRVRALVVAATALALVVALALGYTGSRWLFARPAAPMEKLRIALPAVPHSALLYIAAAKGYYVKTLEPGWKDFAFNVDLPQSLLISLEDEARWAMARGYVDKDQVPNFLPHLHLDALLAVQPERVTVVR
jgi:hypothetical protein